MQYQAYVNEFVKNVIIYHEDIFSCIVSQNQRNSENSTSEGFVDLLKWANYAVLTW